LIVALPQKAEKEPEEEEEDERKEEDEEEEEMQNEESLSGEEQQPERDNRYGQIMTMAMAQLNSAEPKALMRFATNRNDESSWAGQQCSQSKQQSSPCPTSTQSIGHHQLLPLQQVHIDGGFLGLVDGGRTAKMCEFSSSQWPHLRSSTISTR
jgi:hypothetical protein